MTFLSIEKKLLTFTACLGLSASLASGQSLDGESKYYQLFSFTDFEIRNTQPEGAVAAGGDLIAEQCSIGAGLVPGEGPVIAVAGDVDLSNGSYQNGTIYVGGSQNIQANAGLSQATVVPIEPPVDFAAAAEFYRGMSKRLSDLTPTGKTIAYSWGGIELRGLVPGLNVFEISESQYESSNGIAVPDFNPEVHTILVNVSGQNVVRGNNGTIFVGPLNAATDFEALANADDFSRHSRLLWNFYEAQSLVSNNSIHGSILAPQASLTHSNGRLVGQLVADQINLLNAAEVGLAAMFDGVLFNEELIAYD